MPVNAKAKGSRAEREAVALMEDITGWAWKRALEEGTTDDIGDLICLTRDHFCVQVKSLANPLTSFSLIRKVLSRQTSNKAKLYRTTQVGFGLIKVASKGFLVCFKATGVDLPIKTDGVIKMDRWSSPLVSVALQHPVQVGQWVLCHPLDVDFDHFDLIQ